MYNQDKQSLIDAGPEREMKIGLVDHCDKRQDRHVHCRVRLRIN